MKTKAFFTLLVSFLVVCADPGIGISECEDL
jgi:hypothetical protein